MIQLPSRDNLEVIEKRVSRIFPEVFKNFIRENSSIDSQKFLGADVSFVQSLDEVENFSQVSSYSPAQLLPFFIDITNQDYYCFDENDKVVVFSVHTIVEEWENFQKWLQWCYT